LHIADSRGSTNFQFEFNEASAIAKSGFCVCDIPGNEKCSGNILHNTIIIIIIMMMIVIIIAIISVIIIIIIVTKTILSPVFPLGGSSFVN